MQPQGYPYGIVKDVKELQFTTILVDLQKNCSEALTSGRLRAPTALAGLNSGPRGMRMLCSKTSLDVKG